MMTKVRVAGRRPHIALGSPGVREQGEAVAFMAEMKMFL